MLFLAVVMDFVLLVLPRSKFSLLLESSFVKDQADQVDGFLRGPLTHSYGGSTLGRDSLKLNVFLVLKPGAMGAPCRQTVR